MASWEEFSQEVSMHGVRVAGSKKYFSVRRRIWLLFIFGMLGYFGWSSSGFLINFNKKLLTTQIRIEKVKELKFPTVTLCNRNLWSKTAMASSDDVVYEQAVKDLYGDDPYGASLKYNYSDPRYLPLSQTNSTQVDEFLSLVAMPLEMTIRECIVFGTKYNCTDMWKVVKTEGGFCFQFNSNGSFKAKSAGKAGGVSFGIWTNVDEYYVGPRSYSEGFTVTFNEHYQVPLVTELGVGLSPGTESAIMLQKSQVKRWPPPANDGRADCFDTDNLPNPLHFYNNYSYSACQVECKTSYVLNKCGCKDAFQPALNGSLTCRFPWLLNCSTPAQTKIFNEFTLPDMIPKIASIYTRYGLHLDAFPSDPEGLAACDCRDACKDVEYTAQVSAYNFPNENIYRQAGLDNATIELYRKNAIFLEIFYGKMSFSILEERLAYGFHDMISNLGGTLGLCVGASILTICEFIEFAIIALSSLFKREQKTHPSVIKVAPSSELQSPQ